MTHLRRAVVALLSLLLTAVALVAGASPAQAAGNCSISVPSRVAVDAGYERIVGQLSYNCSYFGAEWASWDIYHPRDGLTNLFYFDGTSPDRWDYYAGYDGYGTFSVEPGGAFDGDFEEELNQNSTQITVRLHSKLAHSTSRSDKKVTLTVASTRFSPTYNRYRPWAGATVSYQSRTCGSCTWRTFKTERTGSTGRASHTFTQPVPRYYRVVTSSSGTTWGQTTGSKRR